MKNTIVLLLAILSTALSFSQCPPVLDQSLYSNTGGSFPQMEHWQSFVAGNSGYLSKIDLRSSGGFSGSFTIEVYSGQGTGGAQLYSSSKSWNLTGVDITVPWELNCADMPYLTNGSTYTFRILGSYNTFINGSNAYPSGVYYNSSFGSASSTIDMNFRTYISAQHPTVTLTPTNPTCNGGNDGQIVSTVVNGTTPFDFIWSNTATTNNINSLSSGTYTLNVTDVNSCQSCEVSTVLTDPPAVTINAGADATICQGDSHVLTATGTNVLTYAWTGGVGTFIPSPNLSNPTVNMPNTSTLTVTGTNAVGCIATDNMILTVNLLPSVSLSGPTDYCVDALDDNLTSGLPLGGTYTGPGITGTLFSPSTAGLGTHTVTYSYTDVNLCTNTATQTIDVNPLPSITTNADQTICNGGNAIVSASGAPVLTWDNGLGSGASQVVSPTVTTQYNVSATNAFGCFAQEGVIITVNPIPTVNLSSIPSLCSVVGSYTLTEGSPIGGVYSGNGVTGGIFAPNNANIGANTITYTYTDGNGCSGFATQNAQVFQSPTVDAGPDLTICEGEEVTLVGSGADSYSWDNGVTDNTPFTPAEGTWTYTVTGTAANGCAYLDGVNVTVEPSPNLSVSQNQVFCLGDNINLEVSGADSYEWDGNSSGDSYNTSPTSTTDVTVTGIIDNCTSDEIITLTLDDPSIIDAGEDQMICPGFGTNLKAGGGLEYSWSGPNVSDPNNQSIFVTVDSTSYYFVEVTTEFGCVYRDSLLVSADSDPSCTVEFSNTISPNNDGVNDVWIIEGIEGFEENLVIIYNRWGDIVFEENNYNNNTIKWEGENAFGADAIPGTYFYRIELLNGPSYSGWIELIR